METRQLLSQSNGSAQSPGLTERGVEILPGQEMLLHSTGPAASARVVYLEPVQAAAHQNFSGYWEAICSHKTFLAALLVLGIAVGGLYSWLSIPVYTATASLEIQDIQPGGSSGVLGGSEAGGFSAESYVQTQIKVLRTQSLRERAIQRLTASGSLPVSGEPPFNKYQGWARSLAGLVNPDVFATAVPVRADVEVVEQSRVIELTAESPYPDLARQYANALAEEYLDYNPEVRWQAAQRTTEWLTKQLDYLRTKLQSSENQLQKYSQNNGLLYSGQDMNVDEERLRQLQSELSDAEADRFAKESTYEVARSASVDSVPEVLRNSQLGAYQIQLSELRRTGAELLTLYNPEHYKVQQVQAQIDQLEATMRREREKILAGIQNDYETSLARERRLRDAYNQQLAFVADQAQKAVYHNVLAREVGADREVYEELLKRAKTVGIGSALAANNMRILDPAITPDSQSRPRSILNLTLGGLAGLALGSCFIFGILLTDKKLHAPGDVQHHLNVPELGVIPKNSSSGRMANLMSGRMWRKAAAKVPRLERLLPGPEAPAQITLDRIELASWQQRCSVIAESYRSTLTSILTAYGKGRRPGIIVVTSAGKGEGKSTVASNLAIALSEVLGSVLLVDGDFRKPRLHQIFDVPNSWGFSDLLRENLQPKDYPLPALAKPTEIERVSVLPSGPAVSSGSGLVHSRRCQELFARLREEFEMVIIDAPPVTANADARVLSIAADGVVFVIAAGRTSRDEASYALRRLSDDGVDIIGTVLNGWNMKNRARYAYAAYHDA